MAAAIITLDGPRGHLRAIHLAGSASLLLGATSGWAQTPYARMPLPFCPVYPPGEAPAIGASNCAPVPPEAWGSAPTGFQQKTARDRAGVSVVPPLTSVADLAVRSGARADAAPAAKHTILQPDRSPSTGTAQSPSPQDAIAVQTPGAVTLEQFAALLGPASKRAVVFSLLSADDYKKTDLTHRVRLTWRGSLQALVDRLAGIYALDAAIDDTTIRFSSRQRDAAAGALVLVAP